jgi:hypothetical protein
MEFTPDKSSLKSFLHRVKDPRLTDYFMNRFHGDISVDTLETIRTLVKNNPGDLYLDLHLIELEALNSNIKIAEELLKQWEKNNREPLEPMIDYAKKRVKKTLSMEKLKKEYPYLVPYNEVFPPEDSSFPGSNLKETLEWWKKFLEKNELFSLFSHLVHPVLSPGKKYPSPPEYELAIVCSKLIKTHATFKLFQGKHRESLELFASTYRVGQSLNSSGMLINRLIGMSIRKNASSGLEFYVLNACESPEEFEEFLTMLERLKNTSGLEGVDNLWDGKFSPPVTQMKCIYDPYDMIVNVDQKTRHLISDTKFNLVRMAAAAKYHYVKTEKFPTSDKEFDEYIEDGIQKDLFNSSSPLKYKKLKNNHFVIYSFGPDEKDNGASLKYNPTNGTVSDGDIYIDIPPEREYPFPEGPVKAKDAYELLEQFPNGLPTDIFSDGYLLPLSIVESTKNHPVTIFSFGPDTNESDYDRKTYSLTPDTTSPVPTPKPPDNSSDGRNLQKILRRYAESEEEESDIEPYYDPTNGTISNGNLFIEIPGE